MKLKKKSGLMGAVIALSAASLVSVGFASWVISQGTEDTVTGTIKVDDVAEKNYSIEYVSKVTNKVLDDKIVFGFSTAGYTGSNPWLSNDGSIADTEESSAENLTASFTFKIKEGNDYITDATVSGQNASFNGKSFRLTTLFTTTNYGGTLTYNEQSYNNLVGEEPTPTLSFSGGVFTWSVTFTWGEGFGEVNPYKYFNDKPYSEANATEAKNKLGALYTMNASYSVKLSVVQNPSA